MNICYSLFIFGYVLFALYPTSNQRTIGNYELLTNVKESPDLDLKKIRNDPSLDHTPVSELADQKRHLSRLEHTGEDKKESPLSNSKDVNLNFYDKSLLSPLRGPVEHIDFDMEYPVYAEKSWNDFTSYNITDFLDYYAADRPSDESERLRKRAVDATTGKLTYDDIYKRIENDANEIRQLQALEAKSSQVKRSDPTGEGNSDSKNTANVERIDRNTVEEIILIDIPKKSECRDQRDAANQGGTGSPTQDNMAARGTK